MLSEISRSYLPERNDAIIVKIVAAKILVPKLGVRWKTWLRMVSGDRVQVIRETSFGETVDGYEDAATTLSG